MKQVVLPRSRPEAQGISSSAISAFLEAVEASGQEIHSFVIVRHGHVVAEGGFAPYAPDKPHMLFSLSKSFTSTAIGLAIEEGLLTVDDRVVTFFPEDLPAEVSENLASMRIHDLLSMSTGHAVDTMGRLGDQDEQNWVRGFLRVRVDYEPGTHFVYNSGATYMLSAILQKVTGQTLLAYLQPRLFEPLGIENPTWESCPRGINAGGWGLSITTEDIAKFGQLYLQNGMWNGEQLIPASWVDTATAKQISNGSDELSDWTQGYGYQFWRCRHGAYRGDGAFGQYCVVMSKQDAVVAITSGVEDMQAVLNLLWDHLLPHFGEATQSDDESSFANLTVKISSLGHEPPIYQTTSPLTKDISGVRYKVAENTVGIHSISLVFRDTECAVTCDTNHGEQRVRCGLGHWVAGPSLWQDTPWENMVASGTWDDEKTFVMTWRFTETPFVHTVTCVFDEISVKVNIVANVAFGDRNIASLSGKRD